MKYYLILCALALFVPNIVAQNTQEESVVLDSLPSWVKNINGNTIDSTAIRKRMFEAVRTSEAKSVERIQAYLELAEWHQGAKTIDSTLFYLNKSEALSKQLNNKRLEARTYLLYEDSYKARAQYNKAEPYALKALQLYEAEEDVLGTAEAYLRLSDLFYYQDVYDKGMEYARNAIQLLEDKNEPRTLAKAYRYLANNQLFNEEPEAALPNAEKAVAILIDANISDIDFISSRNTRGNIYKYLERFNDAMIDYKASLTAAGEINNSGMYSAALGNIGHVHLMQEEYRSALPYLLQAIDIMKASGNTKNLWENYMHTSIAYEMLEDYKKSLEYDILYTREREAYNQSIIKRLQSELQIKYETNKKEATISEQQERIDRQRKIQFLYIGIGILLAGMLLFMFFSLRNIRRKRQALAKLNRELDEKRKTVEETNKALSKSITDLKAAQAQLIQSEKMASLGELTAGIAHEIQNPLNFVNNFSEVNTELIEELKEEIAKGDSEEINALILDIDTNLQKILHHGQRAEGIVKGMLQHSRTNTGEREAVNINKLADEYLRLSYHGLRAKDKSFNVNLVTDYDEKIDTIQAVPQDLGRVVLNLVTNAFYAVREQTRTTADKNYKPEVSVRTKKLENWIRIEVTDNGNGIPKKIIDKIFQPFYTTKPTGEGTGLGLSLSYDIVTAHGGELTVVSKEGQGTTFTLALPATK
jgi:two-component system NtrC family sensor kinase